ncbi:facilitated trehalose transporter Tret1-like isoform X2 [Hyposmocoma kahamanoa]|nr:facilitated trehalose transporter Tret1-like isoform X2 [Hyposmocoma kahamanoa]
MQVKSEKNCSKTGHTYLQWLLAILVNTTLLTFGLQFGWISATTKVLQSNDSPTGPLTDTEISWVASTLSLSAAFGGPLYSVVADKLGRKIAVLAIIIPQTICWVIKILATNVATLIVGRAFAGLAAGGCFNVIPIYIKEISQDDNIGLLGSLFIMFQNIGIFLIYAIGPYLDYRTVILIALPVPVVTMAVMLKAPETPAFLVKVKRYEEAIATIALLRRLDINDKPVQNEFQCLRNEDVYFKSIPNVSLKTIWMHKPWRRGALLMTVMLNITAFNGCTSIITYASSIMVSSGVTLNPELQTLSFPVIMVLAAFVSMACIERFGRKTLSSIGLIGVAICLISLAIIIHLQCHGIFPPGWLTVACIILALAFYAAGICPVPYIMMSEMFNFQIRAKIIAMI